jgi:hypothetical protein
MRVHRPPSGDRREAEPGKRGTGGIWYRVAHEGALLARRKLGHAGAVGLYEHERADLPGGRNHQKADPDTDQFLVVFGPHAFLRTADAVVRTNRDRPDADAVADADADADADGVRLVAGRRPPVVESG